MELYQRLMKLLAVILFGALLLGVVFAALDSTRASTAQAPVFSETGTAGMRPAALPSEPGALNPDPPSQVVKLVFIHHSCGNNWLDDGHGNLGAALGDNNYYVSDTYYDWGPDSIGSYTDIGHWWLWFRGPNSSTYLSALYTTTTRYANYTRPMADPGGENEIIMFKSCFPNSDLQGQPDDPPTTGDNPLRGQSAASPHHTVGNAKGIYNDILEYFRTRQDRLFVVITAPPVLDATYAASARAFNNWLVDDWLADYPYHNVAVFDFYDVLTTNGGDADTNDLGWSTGNHHRVITATTPMTIEHVTDGDDDANPNVLEYPSWGTDNHPSPAGNRKATGEFIPLLNVYYNCWKHGNCGDDSPDWISVTATNESAGVYPGETATYTLSLAASAGFTAPVTLTVQGVPSGTAALFDPHPLIPPGTSQLYLTTTASTGVGTYALIVTGTSGEVSSTTHLTLTVKPVLHLVAQPDVRAVIPGGTAVYTLSLAASAGFTAPVTLTVQGAPSGTAALFDPHPLIPPGTSQLYLTTTASTGVGTYALTVTGTSGVLTDVVSVMLIVTSVTPGFTLNISPTTHVAQPDQVVSYTVVVTGANGFSQPVTLTVVGLPIGVYATWSINPAMPGHSSILTLFISSSSPFGVHPFQVVGTAETQIVAAAIELIIDRPFRDYLPIIRKSGTISSSQSPVQQKYPLYSIQQVFLEINHDQSS